MPDKKPFQVTYLPNGRHVTIIYAKNVIEARDKFARKKGYKDYGDMFASFAYESGNDLDKPPYSLTEKTN